MHHPQVHRLMWVYDYVHIIYIKIVQGLYFFGSIFHSLDLLDFAVMRIKEMEFI